MRDMWAVKSILPPNSQAITHVLMGVQTADCVYIYLAKSLSVVWGTGWSYCCYISFYLCIYKHNY